MLSIILIFHEAYAYEHNSKQFENCFSRYKFERELKDSGDIFDEMEAFEILPYIDSTSSATVNINGINIASELKVESLSKRRDESIDYNPESPTTESVVNILKKSSVSYSKEFVWSDVTELNIPDLCVVTGNDQNGKEYFSGIEYAGSPPDIEHDADVTGGGDCEFQFFYSPETT